MPGWIIQGERGAGKSLAAVWMIQKYMLEGRPVATNLDLYLDKLLPPDNKTLAYRLPDHPRLQDFQLLPPAYDPKYKKEDKNGLLVLDELGTWLNSRNWNDKTRLKLLNWLFLSRKDHWDIILIAQDYSMIDSQVQTTLCDYLVQSSRLDRQKIPYFSSISKFLGFSGKMPEVHRYFVFYGMSTQVEPEDTWSFTGKKFYEGYNTNQRFRDGMEALDGTLVDLRATYSYLPAAYLSRQIFVDRLEQKIDYIKKLQYLPGHVPEHLKLAGDDVAKQKKGLGGKTADYFKIGLLCFGLLGFLGWRFLSGGFTMPKAPALISSASASIPVVLPASVPVSVPASVPASVPVEVFESGDYVLTLLKSYRPRLNASVVTRDVEINGFIGFYDNDQMIESITFRDLHAFGVVLVKKSYGVDLMYKGIIKIVTSWKLPKNEVAPFSNQDNEAPSEVEKI